MNLRVQKESFEFQYLSPLATKSAESKGRLIQEAEDPIRTCFQRDRDRIIHSKAFRRLKHKTQVFLDPEEDHYRTRLTHTLEVSQIARTISSGLRLNEDLTEAIALGHDLGHTPFGHAGERALDEAVREYLPHASFKHYEHSLRVVDVLERDGKGLNLTHEVRMGIISHSKGRSNLSSKPSDNGTPEGEAVRIADRIGYVNHDLDDAVRAGVLSEKDIPKECIERLGNTHSKRIASMVTDVIETSNKLQKLAMSDDVLLLVDIMKEFLYERLYLGYEPNLKEQQKAERLVKILFRRYVDNPELLPVDYQPKDEALPARVQASIDYVAGMTDRYAVQIFEDMFMPKVWQRSSI